MAINIPGDEKLVPQFSVSTKENKAKSRKEGRPIFDEKEIVTLRIPGDQQRVIVQPAHHVSHWDDGQPVTYAQRFNPQYLRFKDGRAQIQEGTPLAELPFLTESKRMELRAVAVHTAEALAGLDGPHLARLGMGGRELKNQAVAYLEKARGSSDVTAMAAMIAALQQQVADLQSVKPADDRVKIENAAETDIPVSGESQFETFSDEDLKGYIFNATGARPRGNPAHATLVRQCDEIEAARQDAA